MCDKVFAEDEIIWGADAESDRYPVCPNCLAAEGEADELEEVAGTCDKCGKVRKYEDTTLCDDCLDEAAQTLYEEVVETLVGIAVVYGEDGREHAIAELGEAIEKGMLK
jgi:hypothetical protein